MDPDASGNAKDRSRLEETDRAALALFEDANQCCDDRFAWPDADFNARLGKQKQQQLCKARRLLNTRNLEQIQASAAAAAPLAPAQSSALGIQAWTDGVRERHLRGHTARVSRDRFDQRRPASQRGHPDRGKALRSAHC